MENNEERETEQLKLELLKMNVAKMKVELYQKLSEETGDFGNEPIFDKVWLKKHILGDNNEKMFDV
ncbi:MAG TPA: hypothetical protein GX708_23300 [Gallicola sp.]|nr:hypothetical protein [Gallicola sp.]